MTGKLILEDGTQIEGKSFGAQKSAAGEVVFSTGVVGYPESLTDPSYLGQILIFTYPLIGNYGVPDKKLLESDGIKVSGLIVSNYIETPSHHQSRSTLGEWLKNEKIPALEIPDTRFLTQKIRTTGTMLGKIEIDKQVEFYNPDRDNLVKKVSVKKVHISKEDKKSNQKTFLLIDCGAKKNIETCLVKRGVKVITIPWNYNPFNQSKKINFDAIMISNGPGDPKMAKETIDILTKAIAKKIPILGVCLGHQLLTLAAGGDTHKLKFGHRSQNQPCILMGSERCYITTQNHGFAVSNIPKGFKSWFENANDGSNEGIIHEKLPIMSVQFHPEANPGPNDTEWIFDYFLEKINNYKIP